MIGSFHVSRVIHFPSFLQWFNRSRVISANHIVAQSQLPCDPFDTGTTPAIVQSATTNGEENPNACLCAFPCSVNTVGEFVRFYFTRRFVADIICFECLTNTHFSEAKETIVNLM